MRRADLTELIAAAGEAGAQALVERHGGLTVHVPKRLPDEVEEADAHPVFGCLPPERRAGFARTFGGDEIYIPKCDAAVRAARDRAIRAAYDRGARVQDLARAYRLSERRLYGILGQSDEGDDGAGAFAAQGRLF